ncbi:Antirestriction protein ArdC [Enhydrobacter aerosaccus]|uniref:Antirestriction protein ArdC n=1 Tax=Enhydrobacter aerosaccus TaxID=225324 RepID=A0A1T4TJG0_9HYPH|nr:zincin-like metallopeptidase domain-containing protein [Enhydrobacter aerosaccus]SKA40587.1 Antirestriction protein ArdC [Enhydrobacter aerosaccus]
MSVYQDVTAAILAAIETGAGEFQMPWHASAAKFGMPTNATTGVAYRGLNVLLLWSAVDKRRFSTGSWATYKQWAALGAQVRKGEHGTACVKWKDIAAGDGDDEAKRFIPLGFTVFNADQVDGYTSPSVPTKPNEVEAIAAADAIATASGVPIAHRGDSAHYVPAKDEVVMPEQWRFRRTTSGTATQNYYAVLLHELCHATGAPRRCDRKFPEKFGDEARAFEELVAELGAAFCCARLGIHNEPRPDHASYVASWLTILKANPNAFTAAASAAQRASDWLMNRLSAPQQLAA